MSEQDKNTTKRFNMKLLLLIGLPVLIIAAFIFLPKKESTGGKADSPVVGSWYASDSTKGRIPLEIRADGTATTVLGLDSTWKLEGSTLTLTASHMDGRTETYTYNPDDETITDIFGVIYFTTPEAAADSYQDQWGDMISSDTDYYRDTRSVPVYHYYSVEDNSWTIDMTGPGFEVFHDGELVDEITAEDWTWYQTMYDMTMEGHPAADQTIYLIFGEAVSAQLDANDGWFVAVRGLDDEVPTLYSSNPRSTGNQ